MFQKKILFFFLLYINILAAQKNYIDFFLENYNPKEGDFIFQDLDSSPLCDAIEEVTPGIFNQNFSLIVLFLIGYVLYKKFDKGSIAKKK